MGTKGLPNVVLVICLLLLVDRLLAGHPQAIPSMDGLGMLTAHPSSPQAGRFSTSPLEFGQALGIKHGQPHAAPCPMSP